MSDEIKEILDFKEDADYKRLSVDEILILKDYITNLQEELNKLTAESTEWESKCYYWQNELAHEKEKNKIIVKLGDDYKSRCEKAIEYIKYLNPAHYSDKDENNLLNILNGGDDN